MIDINIIQEKEKNMNELGKKLELNEVKLEEMINENVKIKNINKKYENQHLIQRQKHILNMPMIIL